jgi:hypothetical protein
MCIKHNIAFATCHDNFYVPMLVNEKLRTLIKESYLMVQQELEIYRKSLIYPLTIKNQK